MSKLAKHTPGPWIAEDDGFSSFVTSKPGHFATNKDKQVCEGCTEADARLIAAAPEMLEALQQIATQLDYPDKDGSWKREAAYAARSAIAKATGDDK